MRPGADRRRSHGRRHKLRRPHSGANGEVVSVLRGATTLPLWRSQTPASPGWSAIKPCSTCPLRILPRALSSACRRAHSSSADVAALRPPMSAPSRACSHGSHTPIERNLDHLGDTGQTSHTDGWNGTGAQAAPLPRPSFSRLLPRSSIAIIASGLWASWPRWSARGCRRRRKGSWSTSSPRRRRSSLCRLCRRRRHLAVHALRRRHLGIACRAGRS